MDLRNIRTNLKFELDEENIINNVNHNLIFTGYTINHRSYYELSTFSILRDVSDSTLRRNIDKVPNEKCGLYFVRIASKYYVTDAITYINNESFSSLNEINGNWATYLAGFKWDFFGTVRFPQKLSNDSVRKRAETFFDKISSKFKGKGVRLFYTLENGLKPEDGFHFHFLLWVDGENKIDVKKFTEGHFRGKGNKFANTHMVEYDPSQGAIFYMLKEQHIHENGVDFLVKNLS
jgi:hypothetical protein